MFGLGRRSEQEREQAELRDRVLRLEVQSQAQGDRLQVIELTHRYEREVPRQRTFPWGFLGSVVSALALLAYGLFTYLTAH